MPRPDHRRLRRRGKRGSAGCPRPIPPGRLCRFALSSRLRRPLYRAVLGVLRGLIGAQQPKPGSRKAFCGPPSRCRNSQHSSKRGWTGRPGDRARAANPNRRCALRFQAGLEVLLGVHVLACLGLVGVDGLIVVDVGRGRGGGLGALTRARVVGGALGGRIVTVRAFDRALELGQRCRQVRPGELAKRTASSFRELRARTVKRCRARRARGAEVCLARTLRSEV